MGDSLLKSVGASYFVSAKALAAVTFTPEDIDLGDYAFVPFVRTGLAAAIHNAPTGNRATVQAAVDLADSADITAKRSLTRDLTLYGPGDVTGIDVGQIIRRQPAPASSDAEQGYMAHIEFARPDFPWMFSPFPAQGDRCNPWLALVVVEASVSHVDPSRGELPAQLWTKKGQLQPLAENWRFAHAQAVGVAIDTTGPRLHGTAQDTVETRLSDDHAPANLSRILCPRRLDDGITYIAALVPAFDCGVKAGLGLGGGTLDHAWTRAPGDALDDIALPVYDSWTFRTAPGGSFRELAERIKPLPAPWAVGRRMIDLSRPGSGIPDLADGDTSGVQVLECALFSPASLPADQPARTPWPTAHREALRQRLNQANAPDDDLPRIGARLYARYQRAATRVGAVFGAAPFGPNATDTADADWFPQLNTDPMLRIVAALGAKVVQKDQEALMQAAWAQVDGIRKANQAILWAGLAEVVTTSIRDRHLKVLEQGTLMQVTRSLHARLHDGGQPRTVRAAVIDSRTAAGSMSSAFRRALRPGGPVAAKMKEMSPGTMVAGAQGFADHRQVYRQPDGITGVSKAGMQFFTDAALEKVLKTAPDRARALLNRQVSILAETGGALRQLTTTRWDGPRTGRVGDLVGTGLIETVTGRLDQINGLRDKPVGLTERLGEVLVGLTNSGGGLATPATAQLDRVKTMALRADLPRGVAGPVIAGPVLTPRPSPLDRPGPIGRGTPLPQRRGRGPVIVDRPDRPVDPVVVADPITRFETDLSRKLRAGIEALNALPVSALRKGLAEMVTAIAMPPTLQTDLGPLTISKTALLAQIDPRQTARAALKGRLTLLPGAIRPDWIDTAGLAPIMAAPVFNRAMSAALEDYDRDWLVPGLGSIAARDFVTVLDINPAFAEAFLIGASDEMGRELLWRDYPTDQRGTYFKRFWDADQDELTQPIHRFTRQPVGRHFRIGGDGAAGGGALALVVRGELLRRFPDSVIMAVQATSNAVPPTFIAKSEARVLFHTHLDPDFTVVGFDLTSQQVLAGGNWWFLIAQNPTAPRFGLSENASASTDHDKLDWADFGTVPPGGFLPVTRNFDVKDANGHPDKVRWPGHAGVVARVLLTNPIRAAFRADELIASAK
jgi:hypothetical protein